jgi:small neutral amino acid transporter SnatA (MarC family)
LRNAALTGEARSNVAFVPLGTPLLAGPGAIAAAGKPVRGRAFE